MTLGATQSLLFLPQLPVLPSVSLLHLCLCLPAQLGAHPPQISLPEKSICADLD